MRIFECINNAKILDAQSIKLEAKEVRCLFLGYCESTKAYRLMCLDTKKIIWCCIVVFWENGHEGSFHLHGSAQVI